MQLFKLKLQSLKDNRKYWWPAIGAMPKLGPCTIYNMKRINFINLPKTGRTDRLIGVHKEKKSTLAESVSVQDERKYVHINKWPAG